MREANAHGWQDNHAMSDRRAPATHPSHAPDAAPPAWPSLVLGSTSPYRRALLSRLTIPFSVLAPEVDETPRPGEAPAALARRLAEAKAAAVASMLSDVDAVVIGSDQVADWQGQPLGKPGDAAGARAQLQAMRGHTVRFHTAVCVMRPRTARRGSSLVTVDVTFRALSDAEIDAYLRIEQPFDCAGSAKVESLGIALLSRVDASDPTALEGLPMIETCRLLAEAGLPPLSWLAAQR
jgi:septum formation protein